MNTRRQSVTGWLLLLPAAVLLAAFTHYPALATFWHSFFTTPRANRSARFVGLENYGLLLEDPVFWTALTNNAWYALGTILPSMALAIVMALWVNRQMVGRGWVRLAYFTPTVLPMIAVANIWLFFYTPDYGLLDQARSLWGGAPHNWLGSQETALGAVVAVAVWKEAGFFMIFYLAALQQQSPELREAAALLGHAAAVIGVDTGLTHLANALDVPLVAIYTDTDPALTGVVETARAANIGHAGEIPAVDAVLELLARVRGA